MIFNEWSYALFMVFGLVGVAFAPSRFRPLWLALTGAAFYSFYGGFWIVVFFVEIVISRWYAPRSRFALFGICQALGILAVVKYGAFFLGLAGIETAPFSLPLALSFFVFEFVHYAVDRYKGVAPDVPPIEYASFILFFPTMIAGPIKRVQGFTSALTHAGITAPGIWVGGARVVTGLFKKSVLADNVNSLLEGAFLSGVPCAARWGTLAAWTVLYGARIYLDFSAYSDIAIGSARMLGIEVPENFNWPYLARSPSDFWKRWHISLSRWITDYIYVPLGGRSGTGARVALNTFVAMGLSGLWHGAAGNFIVWGLYHAALIVAYRAMRPLWHRLVPEAIRERKLMTLSYILLTDAAVLFGWIFFAMPWSTAWRYAARLLGVASASLVC